MESEVVMETDKLKVVLSICEYLSKEIKNCSSSDSQESLIVALQCVEAAYGISYDNLKITMNIPDLWSALNLNTVELGSDPEIYKQKGNELMAGGSFQQAVDSYSKAIELNPKNAVYYCNRAAAYCRMEKFNESIEDCKTAVGLDPNYSKAYGRLGLAYLSLNLFGEAVEAYGTALRLDPSNDIYKQNFEIAMDRYRCSTCGGGDASSTSSAPRNVFADTMTANNVQAAITQIVNNPNLINMATEMLSDESVRNVMTGLLQMHTPNPGNPTMENLLLMGQHLAQQMQDEHPDFIDGLRRQFTENANNLETSTNTSNSQNTNTKDDTSSDPQDDN